MAIPNHSDDDYTSWVQLGKDIIGKNEDSGVGANLITVFSSDKKIMALGEGFGFYDGNISSGKVTVYKLIDTEWEQFGQVLEGLEEFEHFGSSISLNSDGNILAVGSVGSDSMKGSVKIYQYFPTTLWTQLGNEISGVANNDYTGHSVSLSSDGMTIIINSTQELNENFLGYVSVYNYKVPSYLEWENDFVVKGSDIDKVYNKKYWVQVSDNIQGNNSRSVSMNNNGNIIAIGKSSNDPYSNSGKVDVLKKRTEETWKNLGDIIYGREYKDLNGHSVSVSNDGTVIAMGAPEYDGDTTINIGNVRVYKYRVPTPGEWATENKVIQGQDAASGQQSDKKYWVKLGNDFNGVGNEETLGYSISLSGDGKRIAIGVPGINVNEYSGKVMIFNYNDSNDIWSQIIDSRFFGQAVSENNGWSVSLNYHGTIVAIGAPRLSSSGSGSGSYVHVFEELTNGNWDIVGGYIEESDSIGNPGVGASVSLNDDGDTLAIGRYNHGDNTGYTYVRVYKYKVPSSVEWDSGTVIKGDDSSQVTDKRYWTQIGLNIDDKDSKIRFGTSVSLNSNGNTLAIGGKNARDIGIDTCYVGIYDYNTEQLDGIPKWVQRGGNILEHEYQIGYIEDKVSISGDGNIVAIGTYTYDGIEESNNNLGIVRIYKYKVPTDNEWDTDKVVKDNDDVQIVDKNYWTKLGNDIIGQENYDSTGRSVSLSRDGSVLIVGSPGNSSSIDTFKGFVQVYYLKEDNFWDNIGSFNGEINEELGYSVSLNGDGKIIAMGGPSYLPSDDKTGLVRVYNYDGTSWSNLGDVINGHHNNDKFGYCVSLNKNGNRLAIGANNDNKNGSQAGAAYVYEYKDNQLVPGWNNINSVYGREEDVLGNSVSLNGIGNLLSVTSDKSKLTSQNRGHANVYIEPTSEAIKLGSGIGDCDNISIGSYSFNNDGSILAIGRAEESTSGKVKNGRVRVYKYKVPLSTEWDNDKVIKGADQNQIANKKYWTQTGIDLEGENSNEEFGNSLSLNGKGNILAVGSLGTPIVRVYKYYNDGWNKIYDNTNVLNSDISSVSLNNLGNIIAIGMPSSNTVKIFKTEDFSQWDDVVTFEDTIKTSFGFSVSLNNLGNRVAIMSNDLIKASIYEYNGSNWNQLGQDVGGGGTISSSLHPQYRNTFSSNSNGNIVAIVQFNDNNTFIEVYNYDGFEWKKIGQTLEGTNVSLNSFGDRMAVLNRNVSPDRGGTLTIYKNNGSEWEKLGLTIYGSDDLDDLDELYYGYYLSLNSKGNRVARGFCGDRYINVYDLFDKESKPYWEQKGDEKIGANGDLSGAAISLNNDGTIMAVSHPGNGGKIKTYYYNTNEKIWSFLGNITNYSGSDDLNLNLFNPPISLNGIGNRIIIGQPEKYSNNGEVSIREFDSLYQSWTVLILISGVTDEKENFGYSVSLSNDGKTCAVGSPYLSSSTSEGIVRIYQEINNSFTQIGEDIRGIQVGSLFGHSVSINDDGTIVAVGAKNYHANGIQNLGHVRVYKYKVPTISEWDSVNVVKGDDTIQIPNKKYWIKIGQDIEGEQEFEETGHSVSLNSDGNILAIGSTRYNAGKGNIRIYEYKCQQWVKIGEDINSEENESYIGQSLSLSNDGNIVIFGGSYYDSNGNNLNQRPVRIFKYKIPSYNEWYSNKVIVGNDNEQVPEKKYWTQLGNDYPINTMIGQNSEVTVSLSGDGKTFAIGEYESYKTTGDVTDNNGNVLVYNYVEEEEQVVPLKPTTVVSEITEIYGKDVSELLGLHVATNSDGTFIAFSNFFQDNTNTHIKIYNYNIPDSYQWENVNIIKENDESQVANKKYWIQVGSHIEGETPNDNSGSTSISLSNDGSIIAIGAHYNDGITDNPNDNRGHVRLYKYRSVTSDEWDSANIKKDNDTTRVEYKKYWIQMGEDIDGESHSDESGWSVSLSADGTIVAIGARLNNGTTTTGDVLNDSGHVRVYKYKVPSQEEWDNGNVIKGTDPNPLESKYYWTQLGEDIDGEAAADKSGNSISLSSDGNIIAIGSNGNDGNGLNSGHVRLYEYKLPTLTEWDNGNVIKGTDSVQAFDKYYWTQKGEDIDGETTDISYNYGDQSGLSVSLSSDGNIVAIGAPFNDGTTGDVQDNRGHVRVYQYKIPTQKEWETGNVIKGNDNVQLPFKMYLTQIGGDIDGNFSDDGFGREVSLSGDGLILVITSLKTDGATHHIDDNRGNISIYKFNGNDWQKISDDIYGKEVNEGNSLYNSLKISKDGKTIVYGSPYSDKGTGVDNANFGVVRVYKIGEHSEFESKIDGNWSNLNWKQLGQSLDGLDRVNGYYGQSISFNSIGNRVAIGGSCFNSSELGYVHILEYNNNDNEWVILDGPIEGEQGFDRNGFSVSLSSDGNRVAIGAPYYNVSSSNNEGKVRIYEYNGAEWLQLGASIIGNGNNFYIGLSVSLSSDGNCLAVGGDYECPYIQVYQYRVPTPDEWNNDKVIKGSDTTQDSGKKYWTLNGENILSEINKKNSVSLNYDGSILAVGTISSLSLLDSVTVYDFKVPTSEEWSNPNVVIKGSDTTQVSGKKYWTQLGEIFDDLKLSYDINVKSNISLSNDGSIVAIGDFSHNETRGRVRVYYYDSNKWCQLGSDIYGELQGDRLGFSVSLNSDGKVVAIGVPHFSDNDIDYNRDRVVVYHYKVPTSNEWYSGNVIKGDDDFKVPDKEYWTQIAQDIFTSDLLGDISGLSVSLNDLGTIVGVGSPYKDNENGRIVGHVRVYNLEKDLEPELDKLWFRKGQRMEYYNQYTNSPPISLSDDGNIVAIGDSKDDLVKINYYNGLTWEQMGFDIPWSRGIGESNYDLTSISLSSDGTIVAIGNYRTPTNIYKGNVQVYKYKVPTSSEWSNGNVIKGSDGTQVSDKKYWTQLGEEIYGKSDGDRLGWSVSLSSDGTIVAIGAPNNDGTTGDVQDNRGQVQLYEYKVPTQSEWNDGNVIKGTDSVQALNKKYWTQKGGDIYGEAAGDESGWSVSLSSDGTIVAIGAPNNIGNGFGYVHVYEYRVPSYLEWNDSVIIKENDLNQVSDKRYWIKKGGDIYGEAEGDRSGWSISLSGDGNVVAIEKYSGNEVKVLEYKIPTVNEWYNGSVIKEQDIDQVIDKKYWTYNTINHGEERVTKVSLSGDGNILLLSYAYGTSSDASNIQVYKYKYPTSDEWNLNKVNKGNDIFLDISKKYWTKYYEEDDFTGLFSGNSFLTKNGNTFVTVNASWGGISGGTEFVNVFHLGTKPKKECIKNSIIQLKKGWNMIGLSHDGSILDESKIIYPGGIFHFDGNGYGNPINSDNLEKHKGYWINSKSDGTINIYHF